MSWLALMSWMLGLYLYWTSSTENVDETFKMMWGARLVAFGTMMNAVYFWGFQPEPYVIGYIIAILNTWLFFVYAVREYHLGNTFKQQYWETYEKN